jgi:beta-phosphoglucomutase-like phosphatase (HAD superfamily)
MRTLCIFDFDDTLITSNAKVRIIKQSGHTKKLSTAQYAKYAPQEGDVFDFVEFDRYPKQLEIIKPVFAELQASITIYGHDNVVILTARSNPLPVKMFLHQHNIPNIEVKAVGSSDPMMKARYILDRLKSAKFDQVIVFEDNVKNIRTIQKVVSKTGIKLKTNRVKNGLVHS